MAAQSHFNVKEPEALAPMWCPYAVLVFWKTTPLKLRVCPAVSRHVPVTIPFFRLRVRVVSAGAVSRVKMSAMLTLKVRWKAAGALPPVSASVARAGEGNVSVRMPMGAGVKRETETAASARKPLAK